jgi:hypothetical protein
MATRNVQRFIDPSSLPFWVPIPFTGLTAGTSPLTVLSAVISATHDFYGFIVRSRGPNPLVPLAYQFQLVDGSGVSVTLGPVDGVDVSGNEITRNLGEADNVPFAPLFARSGGSLVPFFSPAGTKITVVLTTGLAGPIAGMIEVRGVLNKA